MSTRRGGKKKAQQKQQTITAEGGLQDDDAQPAVPAITQTPASPAVTLAKQALTPIVTAAKAITAATATVLASALPVIAEDAAINTAHVDNDHPGTPKSPRTTENHFLSNTAQQLFASEEVQEDEQQQQHSHSTQAPQGPPQHQHTGQDADDEDMEPGTAPGHLSVQLHICLQHLHRCMGWKGGLVLCALVLVPLLAVVAVQSQQLKLQAQLLHDQQQQVAAQALALQDLQQALQETSAQLPSLMDAAHTTSNSLTSLTAEQSSLLDHLKGLSNVTQQLVQEVSHINGSQQAGKQAWQVLTAVTNPECAVQPDNAACSKDGAAPAPNASLVMQALLQKLSGKQQQQQQDSEHLHAQQQLLQGIKHEVKQQLSVQLLPIDLALADCGGVVVFSTGFNTSYLQQQLGTRAGSPSSSASRGMPSFLQHLLTPKPPAAAPTAATTPDNGTKGLYAAESPSSPSNEQLRLMLHRVLLRPASGLLPSACVPMLWGSASRPAVIEVQLPQPAHIHSVTINVPHSMPATADTSGGTTAALPQHGHVTLALLNSSSCGGAAVPCTNVPSAGIRPAQEGVAGGDDAAELPGEPAALTSNQQGAAAQHTAGVSLDQSALSTRSFLKDGVEAVVQELKVPSGPFPAGRTVIPTVGVPAGTGSSSSAESAVLADRVVLVMSGGEGANGPCMARISVQGRPTDPYGFC